MTTTLSVQHLLKDITEGDHEDGSPHSQTNSWGHTSVQSLDTILAVNVLEGRSHTQVLWSVRVAGLGSHLDSNNLDGSVPGTQTTTNNRTQDLLVWVQRLTFGLLGDLSDHLLSQTGESEPRTPVGHSSNSHGVDTLVDSSNTLLCKNLFEHLQRRLSGSANVCLLGSGDLHRLQTGGEAHGQVTSGQTTGHTTSHTSEKVGSSQDFEAVFGLSRHEQKHGTLGGGLDPRPGDKASVEPKNAPSRPNMFSSSDN